VYSYELFMLFFDYCCYCCCYLLVCYILAIRSLNLMREPEVARFSIMNTVPGI